MRPVPDMAKQVSCVPYDVVGETEVREFLGQHPLSFLKVTRAEGDLTAEHGESHEAVFERARKNLEEFISSGIYAIDNAEALYVYQLSSGDHVQTGIVGCCSLNEYAGGTIKKHEKVRPDKVEDRTEHLRAVGAQTGLILLAFRGTDKTRDLMNAAIAREPLYDFVCMDGISQRVWRVTDTAEWETAFAEVPSLYVADGHHRIESALVARDKRASENHSHTGNEEYNFVVAGVFPAEDLRILPYDRMVRDLKGLSVDDFYQKVSREFEVLETNDRMPNRHGDICVYAGGKWTRLAYMGPTDDADAIGRLDVSILQRHILEPLLGIRDARTDERISFVGGKQAIDKIERVVDSGEAAIGFSLFPTTMQDLLSVSDLGEIMPPKSTWFEPKLKDGLLVHLI